MLARYRQKDTLPRMLPFINGILTEYNNTAVELRDFRKKDGALVAIASLAKVRQQLVLSCAILTSDCLFVLGCSCRSWATAPPTPATCTPS